MDKKIRALKAEEIECKITQVGAKGCQLLLYKDARCDKRILDETFGICGWANCYTEIKGNLFCSIMIFDPETEMWIQKQDCGVESAFGDKEKGEASDAFKRACFNIGIGRELYTKIFIFIKDGTMETDKKDKYGKPTYKLENPYQTWHVNYIETDNETEKIKYIEIADKDNNVVFKWGKKEQVKAKTIEPKMQTEKAKMLIKEQLDELMKEANGRGDLVVKIAQDFGYDNPRKIKQDDFEKIKDAIHAEILM